MEQTRQTVEPGQAIRIRKGAEIAKTKRITKRGPVWVVPSQTHGGSYVVENDGVKSSCTCPDHELRQLPCKHVVAVEIVRTHSMPDGTIVQETLRVTYSQDWPAYNLAKTHDKERTEMLLRDLCRLIVEPEQHMGRKRVPLRDAIPMAAMKVYSKRGGREQDTDTRRLAEGGLVAKASYWTTVLRTIADPGLTPLLKSLVEESASPLVAIEDDFATDSSGFGCATYHHWHDHKHKKQRKEHSWVKAHLTCGVRTHVITAIVVKPEWSADSPEMIGLLDTTAKRFTAREHSGDKAYSGHANLAKIISLGAQPLIPFREGTGEGADSPLFWRKAFYYFNYNRPDFLAKYHKRRPLRRPSCRQPCSAREPRTPTPATTPAPRRRGSGARRSWRWRPWLGSASAREGRPRTRPAGRHDVPPTTESIIPLDSRPGRLDSPAPKGHIRDAMFRPAVRRALLDRALLVAFVLLAVAIGAVSYRDCKAGRVRPSLFMPGEPPQ